MLFITLISRENLQLGIVMVRALACLCNTIAVLFQQIVHNLDQILYHKMSFIKYRVETLLLWVIYAWVKKYIAYINQTASDHLNPTYYSVLFDIRSGYICQHIMFDFRYYATRFRGIIASSCKLYAHDRGIK